MFWPFKKRGTKLYGFDLDKYSYLGYTKVEWGDAKAYVHGFVHKTNGRRYWHIDPGIYTFKPWDRHPYVMFAELWRVGEKHIASIAADFQSTCLKDLMVAEGYIWSDSKKWWITKKKADMEAELKVIWNTFADNKDKDR